MTRKEFLGVLLVAGFCGMVGGGIVNYLMIPPMVIAESGAPNRMEEFLQREKQRQAERNKHLKSLDFVQAEGLVLRDKQGNQRAMLSTEPDGEPFLEMFNGEGMTIARLDPTFFNLDPHGDFSKTVSLSPRLLSINNGENSFSVSTVGRLGSEEGSANLMLSDSTRWVTLSTLLDIPQKSQLTKALFGKLPAGPGLSITKRKDGKAKIIRLAIEAEDKDNEGGPFLDMYNDEDTKPSFILKHLSLTKDRKHPIAAMGIFDEKGEVIWSAPY